MKNNRQIRAMLKLAGRSLLSASLITVAATSNSALADDASLALLNSHPSLNEVELQRIQGQGARFSLQEVHPVHIILWDEDGRPPGKPRRNGNINIQVTMGRES